MKLIFKEPLSQRIDKYLSSLKMDELYSRSFVNKLISDGNVLVNGSKEKKQRREQVV